MYDFRVNDSDPIDTRLIAWLADGLDKRGKTQIGLANYLGVTQPRISEMLKRKRRFQLTEIPKIAEYIEQAPPPEWLQLNPKPDEPPISVKGEIRFGLHEDPKRVWVLVFFDNKLVGQFEADAGDLDNLRRQLMRAIDSLPPI